MKKNVRPNLRAFRFIAGWCALALYVGAFSPVGLGLTALLGALDRDHQIVVRTAAAGSRVVLHHGGNCAAHNHRAVARALTLFAEPVRAGQPDHVIQFSTADSFSRPAQMTAPSPTQFEQAALVVTEILAWSQDETFNSAVSTPPPPCATGQLLCLRSTVLLI